MTPPDLLPYQWPIEGHESPAWQRYARRHNLACQLVHEAAPRGEFWQQQIEAVREVLTEIGLPTADPMADIEAARAELRRRGA